MLEVKSLHVSYSVGSSLSFKKKHLLAVEDTSFRMEPGETLGLVGESGCGKSTLGRSLLGLVPVHSGEIYFENQPLHSYTSKDWFRIRKDIQVIFQDPYSSLNPRMTIEEIITEGLDVHNKDLSKSDKRKRAEEILERVNLPANILERFPHEFSGGQRQRIAIARALILKPKFLICDEAVSALDISTQASVMNLLKDLKNDFNLSYLFISHDLGIVKYISDKIAVMYLGKIVEWGNKNDIINKPMHPYTKALFDSSFDIKNRNKKRTPIKGEIPSVMDKPTGCHFHTRCPKAQDKCKMLDPSPQIRSHNQSAYCHFPLD